MLGEATAKLGFTRLTMARTWGKPPPSLLEYTLHLSMGVTSKWPFVRDSQVGIAKFPPLGLSQLWGP